MSAQDIGRNSRRLKVFQWLRLRRQPHNSQKDLYYADLIEARMINDELTELLLIIVQDEKEKQTIASRGRTLLQYARRYGTRSRKHVSYVVESLKKCGIDM